eukprot:CAMPEP_0117521184 /NCGR_PEP_ID=MMETSP0784-20121206/33554_1 /TAXON_ID=39447 /ORGANISM="" /LENGTH=190 /DNA_ID=CAMNT_0005317203 /DNA_START=103 /DNA_END=671 /DNA_ORIENTATION=-
MSTNPIQMVAQERCENGGLNVGATGHAKLCADFCTPHDEASALQLHHDIPNWKSMTCVVPCHQRDDRLGRSTTSHEILVSSRLDGEPLLSVLGMVEFQGLCANLLIVPERPFPHGHQHAFLLTSEVHFYAVRNVRLQQLFIASLGPGAAQPSDQPAAKAHPRQLAARGCQSIIKHSSRQAGMGHHFRACH